MIAGDQFGAVGLDDRQHTVGDLVERRLAMDLAPIGVFFSSGIPRIFCDLCLSLLIMLPAQA
jgi:hypothetical protein